MLVKSFATDKSGQSEAASQLRHVVKRHPSEYTTLQQAEAGNICWIASVTKQHQLHPRTKDLAVSVIDCDYLPIEKVVFSPELALLIIRKVSAMAAAFEEQALDQLTKDARHALSQGTEPRRIITEMRL